MNIENILKVADYLDQLPVSKYRGDIYTIYDANNKTWAPGCVTAHVFAIFNPDKPASLANSFIDMKQAVYDNLGLDYDQRIAMETYAGIYAYNPKKAAEYLRALVQVEDHVS